MILIVFYCWTTVYRWKNRHIFQGEMFLLIKSDKKKILQCKHSFFECYETFSQRHRIKSSNLFAHSKHDCAIHQENLSTFHFLPKYRCYTFYQCLWFSYVNRLKLFTTVKYTQHIVLEWKIIYLNLLKLICLSQHKHWHSQCPIKKHSKNHWPAAERDKKANMAMNRI